MTWSPRALRALAMLLGGLLLVVGYWWWQGRARPVITLPDPVPSATPTSSAAGSSAAGSSEAGSSGAPVGEVTVHVRGRVQSPGVVTLPSGSRVIDAIEAAGGLRPGSTSGDLNLARVLVDGEQVAVGVRASRDSVPASPASGGMASDAGQAPALLDLNAATATELEALPGIGPVLAQRIVQWRIDNGRFTDVEVLGEVSGIGDALMAQLRPLVRV